MNAALNRYTDARVLWQQWTAMPLVVPELVCEFIHFQDYRWYLVLGDNDGIIPHIQPDGAFGNHYDWHFGWQLGIDNWELLEFGDRQQ